MKIAFDHRFDLVDVLSAFAAASCGFKGNFG